MVLRLDKFSPELDEIQSFFAGEEFNQLLARKFDMDFEKCTFDGGIQKDLDGYEISPHPDIRSKALSFMLNLNPGKHSEQLQHHTHLLKFKKKYKFVQTLLECNETLERFWVPWDWCETVKIQSSNNSIIIFSPSDDTLHAVKANYNHLITQRTQVYGNLWYNDFPPLKEVWWEEVGAIVDTHTLNESQKTNRNLIKRVASKMGRLVKRATVGASNDNQYSVGKRKMGE